MNCRQSRKYVSNGLRVVWDCYVAGLEIRKGTESLGTPKIELKLKESAD